MRGLLYLAPLLSHYALAAPPIIDVSLNIPQLQEQAQTVFRSGSNVAKAVMNQFESWMEEGKEFIRNKDIVC